MQSKLTWAAVGGGAILAVAAYVGTAFATPASGFVGTTIAKGQIEDFDVMVKSFPEGFDRPWISTQKLKGPSDLYVQNNIWSPGGSTGWHTHPGHSLIIVTAGTVTAYDGDDPSCTPRVYTVGMAFVDEGGHHVHLIRNEGAVEARTVAVQLVPAGATRRIDATGSPGCPF